MTSRVRLARAHRLPGVCRRYREESPAVRKPASSSIGGDFDSDGHERKPVEHQFVVKNDGRSPLVVDTVRLTPP